MLQSDSLPLLPGLSFNRKIGWEKWHKSSQLDWINGKIPYLVDPKRPTSAGNPFPWDPPISKYSSLYPTKENAELPAWIIYDKQILSFEAYFSDDGSRGATSFQIRKVKINYFLEDGTIQVNERKVSNCGISQGTLISRRRIPFPKPMEKSFYELIDFNIGKKVELFGRIYFIYNCDKFTRQWLNRSGVPVPEPMATPDDSRPKEKNREKVLPKKPDKLGQFLKFDGHILRFYGYWDDRESEGGFIHKLILQYYLSDDTIDVREEGGGLMLARSRLPKSQSGPPSPGASDPIILLNVMTTGYLKGRMAKDAKNVGALNVEYYMDSDLLPGVIVNVYGRAVVLTSCDAFTQEFYRAKFGIENFAKGSNTPPDGVASKRDKEAGKTNERDLPPWNGFGSFEDSAGNCVSLVPKPAYGDIAKKLVKARSGLDSNILRFRARMLSDEPIDQDRRFVVAFYLMDDTTSIFEDADRNSGFERRMFIGRKEAFKPVENLFVSRKPWTYSKEDFWVGNVLEIDKYRFELLEADEYCLRYMEVNSQEFPKSNIELILYKIREKMRPVYKKFVQDYLLPNGQQCITPGELAKALKDLLGPDITPHEIITVARHFALDHRTGLYDKQTLRDICRNECRRFLFLGYQRLLENLREKDPAETGFIPRAAAYSMCRGAKVPVEKELLNTLLDGIDKNEAGEVKIQDLISFFDIEQNKSVSFVPFNHARQFSHFAKLRQSTVRPEAVDCVKLIERLGLEEELRKEG